VALAGMANCRRREGVVIAALRRPWGSVFALSDTVVHR
jgi:hypothetical protein